MKVGWVRWRLGGLDGGWVSKIKVGWVRWRLGGLDGGWVG